MPMQRFLCFLVLLSLTFTACQEQINYPISYGQYPIDSTLVVQTALSDKINESSGLQCIDGEIWTLNDSGNFNALYQVDANADKIIHQVTVNAVNNDWEAIAYDDDYIYIGDFGNNGGNRKDLSILKINRGDLKKDQLELSDAIAFNYPEQTNFDNIKYQHDFDCEAMFALGDSLFLFTKNFKNHETSLYTLAKEGGAFAAAKKDSFDVKGTLTGADITPDSSKVVLLGYNFDGQTNTFFPFVWLFWDFKGTNFFSGKNQRVNFPNLEQMEGICHWKGDVFLISSEKNHWHGQELYAWDASPWLQQND